uniref:DRBM domain-containing protein n=1 Tax=Acrobeloides nanus TaxID=290746 RepID=A0A914ECN9_9BILA
MESNLWCSKDSNSKEQNGKHVYNYAERKSDNEKTPMCRIAELARYNKLKHEYILLDESGPAHKKRFTVKLVLCPGEEFEGSGASIKKAQQSAADVAIQKTTLPRPQQKVKKINKDSSNPIMLLKTVAIRLSLEVHYHDETIIHSVPSYNNFPVNPSPLCLPIQSPSQLYPSNQFGISSRPPLFPGPIYPNGAPSLPPFNIQHPSYRLATPPPTLFNFHPNVKNKQVMPHMNAQLPFPNPNMRMAPPPVSFIPTSMSYPSINQSTHGQANHNKSTIHKFVVKLSDGTQHVGTGAQKYLAKMNAATQALLHLRPALVELENKISMEKALDKNKAEHQNEKERISDALDFLRDSETPDSDEGNGDTNLEVHTDEQASTSEIPGETKRKKSKSVVSQVHECALRLKMNVEFEVLMESGEPHNRRYLLRCRLSSNAQSIIADGEGASKKSAKQDACKKLLEKIRGIENDPLYLASVIVKSSKKNAFGNVKEAKRKTIVKDMKLNPQYGQHINPVSRLIQVMQIRKEPEPIFRLIGEHGQNRSREFTVEVTCQGVRKEGTGPNKKLAKRAAAEAMLNEIGYVKPMPQPGKSLLKKKNMPSELASTNTSAQQQAPVMEIGVFNPNEVVTFASIENGKDIEQTEESLAGRITALSLETFADVENSFNEATSPSPVIMEEETEKTISIKDEADMQPIRSIKRRVTFSNEVSACPPDDSSQTPVIAPLKSEVVLVNKLKKRGKDSKKYLSTDERRLIASLSRLFLTYTFAEERKAGLVPSEEKYYSIEFLMHISVMPTTSLVIQSAKDCLEKLAKTYKFTVVYSDFPKAQTDVDAQYFSLVTLGFEKPIVSQY